MAEPFSMLSHADGFWLFDRRAFFRWTMTRKDTSASPSQLQIELFEAGSKECLACIHGPGFLQKKCWVRQPQPDALAVQQSDDRAWLQLVIVTGMIAAKTQRHKDKVTDRSRKSGHGFV